jgi:sec-independent protein translocase protein TatA
VARLFDSPGPIIIIVVALLLFAAPKLPIVARSLGQSMRIFRSEVKEMTSEADDSSSSSDTGKRTDEGEAIPVKGAGEREGVTPVTFLVAP